MITQYDGRSLEELIAACGSQMECLVPRINGYRKVVGYAAHGTDLDEVCVAKTAKEAVRKLLKAIQDNPPRKWK